MLSPNATPSSAISETLDLGALLGQIHAFELIGGRCSAAQAASLRRLRDDKGFRRVTRRRREFCSRYLKMTGRQADKIIRLWEELGAAYFDLAQFTRISPEAYRAIAPAIRDGTLRLDGEVIPLTGENARRVAVAVAELRRRVTRDPARQLPVHQRIARIEQRATLLIGELREISRRERCGENWLLVTNTVERLRTALQRIEAENGM